MCVTNTLTVDSDLLPWPVVCNHVPWRSASREAREACRYCTVCSRGGRENRETMTQTLQKHNITHFNVHFTLTKPTCAVKFSCSTIASQLFLIPPFFSHKTILRVKSDHTQLLLHTSSPELDTTGLISRQHLLSRLYPLLTVIILHLHQT